MAASSMAPVFADAEEQFLTTHPCITNVSFSYGSSATLAAQIVNGSPADVFISASEATMITVKNAGKTLSVDLFAKNVGEIMVSLTSKFVGRITDIGSLTDAVNPGINDKLDYNGTSISMFEMLGEAVQRLASIEGLLGIGNQQRSANIQATASVIDAVKSMGNSNGASGNPFTGSFPTTLDPVLQGQ